MLDQRLHCKQKWFWEPRTICFIRSKIMWYAFSKNYSIFISISYFQSYFQKHVFSNSGLVMDLVMTIIIFKNVVMMEEIVVDQKMSINFASCANASKLILLQVELLTVPQVVLKYLLWTSNQQQKVRWMLAMPIQLKQNQIQTMLHNLLYLKPFSFCLHFPWYF